MIHLPVKMTPAQLPPSTKSFNDFERGYHESAIHYYESHNNWFHVPCFRINNSIISQKD